MTNKPWWSKMVTMGGTGCAVYGDSLYQLCNFSVSLKWFQNKNFIPEKTLGRLNGPETPTLNRSHRALVILRNSAKKSSHGHQMNKKLITVKSHTGTSSETSSLSKTKSTQCNIVYTAKCNTLGEWIKTVDIHKLKNINEHPLSIQVQCWESHVLVGF